LKTGDEDEYNLKIKEKMEMEVQMLKIAEIGGSERAGIGTVTIDPRA